MLRLVEEYKEPNKSFLDDENQMVIDALYTEIAEYVFEAWLNNNLDEGMYYADREIAILSDDPYIRNKFNTFYKLTEDDDDFLN
jgi:hypothetical protein